MVHVNYADDESTIKEIEREYVNVNWTELTGGE